MQRKAAIIGHACKHVCDFQNFTEILKFSKLNSFEN